ncbi:MAG: TonB-dependent receptor [Novosphingobium sp.]
MRKTLAWAAGVSLAAIAFGPAAASAQTTPAGGTSDDAAADSTDQNEIVVTAQGRAQQLADVPVAISAVNAESLKNSGANDIRQLNQLAPSLLVSSTGSEANGSARIRGIGTVGDNPGLESSVPVFIDGVYRSRSGIGLNELGEIDRIEVQRGPQGTLGGRNSSAGLISIYSKKPSFKFGANAEGTYGNYNFFRLGGSITGPLSQTLAARIDGIYVKRDGFLHDTTNNIDVNNRNRYFVRGQLLFEPTDALSVRLIADYTHRDERCCGAIYIDRSVNPFIGDLNNPSLPVTATGNNIVNVLNDLGQPLAGFNPHYNRTIYVSPGRSFQGTTKDYGFSGEINYDLGGAKLTSITAYRDYKSGQGSDTDYSAVDILYRTPDGSSFRQFKTFTQELRLQGKAFDDKFDWLIGGFYANEDLTVTDNLKFGSQYGRFATCRVISGGGFAFAYDPTAVGCIKTASRPTVSGAFGAAGPLILAAFDRLDTLNNMGSTLDTYKQNDSNYALFTHNIVHLTSKLDFTFGVRWTHDRKNFNATFGNNNTVCPAQQAALDPFLGNAGLAAISGALIGLSCQGNSTSELNGVSVKDTRSENKWTGTAILSYRPTEDFMTYASFSRGYKAGGFNLDRSALKSPTFPFANTVGGAQAFTGALKFDPELVKNYEIGFKWQQGKFNLNMTVFRSDFSNFQLNTFNGTVFLVQNINGCKDSLNFADQDASDATGACPSGRVGWGVRAEGFEIEAGMNPARNFHVTAGVTYTDTYYRQNLVGNSAGAPLSSALRLLPGKRLSNAPEWVVTSSMAWTPRLGNSGWSGLVYVDSRMSSDYNTGSDLFPQKGQDAFAIVNARIGVRGPDDKWSLEFWGQNIFDQDYAQVAFSTPFQAGGSGAPFVYPTYPGGRQLFSQFLAEPRTYGVTARVKF